MQVLRVLSAILLIFGLAMPSAARAQQRSIVDPGALDQAIRDRVTRDQADRDAIDHLLGRAEVREIARKAGLPIERAQAAVATLDGAELRQLADQARQADTDLSGGATTLVITTTTLIIILLIIILIIVAVD